MDAKKLVRIALLSALALGIYVLEAQLPMPIAGVKLGLANLVTLCAMYLIGRRGALCVLLVRLVLGSVLAGNLFALAYSAAGGAASFAVMALLVRVLPRGQMWVASVLGAIAHMAGQMAVAVYVTGTAYILMYGLLLMAAAIVTGAFNGVCAQALCAALSRIGEKH